MTTTDAPLIAENKADFDSIYTAPDPRPYHAELRALDYQIPQLAAPIFARLLEASRRDGRMRTVLDVCCSYGLNSAALRRRNPWDVVDRYTDPAVASLTSEQLADSDASFFAQRPDLRVLGLDLSAPAIGYAKRARLLDDGWAENLEADDPSAELASGVRDVGLILCTGGFGYVGERTFERLLSCVERPDELWLAVFVLRVFDFAPTARMLSTYGLVTERLEGTTFPQRRFADDAERDAALHDLRLLGVDPTGRETDGRLHAELFLTRPAADAARMPLDELCQVSAART